ncbi:MAG TPA: DUF1858 domain-containing protein [Syntrophorhabdaceae bacterium]|nr:DUF1858 domain-containing protein [Syntrophorhabdaceae bacterium]HQM81704.1 DUF1858 domain-containing protein [Syntrophorhabdaceae bacterium]
MTIKELLERHPTAINVFIERKMLCVGCPVQEYHTLEEVARIYGVTLSVLMESVRHAIKAAKRRPSSVKFNALPEKSGKKDPEANKTPRDGRENNRPGHSKRRIQC